VHVYDNSRRARLDDDPSELVPRLVLKLEGGCRTFTHGAPPDWLRSALRGTKFAL